MGLKRYGDDGTQTGGNPYRSADWDSGAHDSESLTLHFQDLRPHLLKLCGRLLREPENAQDAVSETYLRAFVGWRNFDGANVPGWLSRIAKHICLDRIRRDAFARGFDAASEPVSPDSEMRLLTAIQIRSILAGLPDEQRRCLKLFYIDGFNAKEVATKTRFTNKQVKSYLQNGRRNFILAWKALDKGDA